MENNTICLEAMLVVRHFCLISYDVYLSAKLDKDKFCSSIWPRYSAVKVGCGVCGLIMVWWVRNDEGQVVAISRAG